MDPAAGTGSGGVASAGEVPMAAAPGAVVVPMPVAAAPPVAGAAAAAQYVDLRLKWMSVRRTWAQALFVLGCVAAALAFFSMNSDTADSRRSLGTCAPTDAEAAALRAAAEELLLAAAAQVLEATTAVLLPVTLITIFGTLLGSVTAYLASHLLSMLVACHARDDVLLSTCYWVFVAMLCVAYLVGCILSMCDTILLQLLQ